MNPVKTGSEVDPEGTHRVFQRYGDSFARFTGMDESNTRNTPPFALLASTNSSCVVATWTAIPPGHSISVLFLRQADIVTTLHRGME